MQIWKNHLSKSNERAEIPKIIFEAPKREINVNWNLSRNFNFKTAKSFYASSKTFGKVV